MWRFCSSIPSRSRQLSDEELQAIVALKQKAEQVSPKASDNVMRTRCWAKAPVLEVSGRAPSESWQRLSKKGQRFHEEAVDQSIVKLRWTNFAERDVDIILSPTETLYTVEVKAVLYGIINAIDWNETKVRMKSTNEIVVKVANKRYKASKELASFRLIQQVVSVSDTKSREGQLQAKLERISEPDKPIRRIASATMTENEFFRKYCDSIEKLKTFL